VAYPGHDALLGAEVAGYRLEDRIGEGSIGIVYRGRKEGGETAAIKVVRPELAGDQRYAMTVIAEARAVSSIGHNGIVSIFDLGLLADGRPFVVMELIEGRSLEEQLQRGPMDPEDALDVLDALFAALDAAHRKNVLHRDIKPANIYLANGPGKKPIVKLLDFGLARLNFAPGSTASMVVGTPDYMAPEQASSKLTYASDLYSAGVVAFRMLTGRLPFTGASTMEVIFAHVRNAAPKPSTLRPGLPQKIDNLVMALLEKSPSQRPPSAEAARAAVLDLKHVKPTDETLKPFSMPSLMDDDEGSGSHRRTEPFQALLKDSSPTPVIQDQTERQQISPFAYLPPQVATGSTGPVPAHPGPNNETVREMQAQHYDEDALAPTKERPSLRNLVPPTEQNAAAAQPGSRGWLWAVLAVAAIAGAATFAWFRLH
jgi:serine/threonine protein kinase